MLVGYFSVESNSFVDAETTLDDFRRQTFAVGAELHREVLGPASELTGSWDVLDEAGFRIVPSVAAGSSPAPPVTDEVVETVLAHLLGACNDELAGVYLALHGSAVSRSHERNHMPTTNGRALPTWARAYTVGPQTYMRTGPGAAGRSTSPRV